MRKDGREKSAFSFVRYFYSNFPHYFSRLILASFPFLQYLSIVIWLEKTKESGKREGKYQPGDAFRYSYLTLRKHMGRWKTMLEDGWHDAIFANLSWNLLPFPFNFWGIHAIFFCKFWWIGLMKLSNDIGGRSLEFLSLRFYFCVDFKVFRVGLKIWKLKSWFWWSQNGLENNETLEQRSVLLQFENWFCSLFLFRFVPISPN